MNSQDFSDGSDESDLDYKPPGEEEKLSEIDSDDVIEDDEDGSNVSVTKSRKSSKKLTKGKRCSQKRLRKMREIEDETAEKTKEEVNSLLNSIEEDKKRLDALWEEFQRPVPKKSSCSLTNTVDNKSKSKEPMKIVDKPETTKKRNFEELFDSSDSSKKSVNDDDAAKSVSFETKTVVAAPGVKAPGGIANILSQIGKKSKLTILEKSKLDWDGYKKKEGIVEELISHNKGKDGYLEKKDFLERTDLRQFELEKAMRAANRLHRN